MVHEKGNISIHTENIFPIIKKWLYSEKDIFIRELVSNSADAISKLKKLAAVGEASLDEGQEFKITVSVNKDEKTIKVSDNGIGMTEEEVKKYINQIAFSGAKDFLEKYKDKTDDQQIIGHFGLGFYSSFMVAKKVKIDTLSYQPNSEAVQWISSGDTEFEMDKSDRNEIGTTITLYMADDSLEFLEGYEMRQLLGKYFSFLSVPIYVIDECEKKEEDDKEDKTEEKEVKPEPINDTTPLWLKNPKDCTDEEYKEFYRNTFMDFNEPLFWIHINMDYPFNMQGIIYFPKLKHEFETMEGQIKLFYNQVFVANNIKEVIPEFLLLLKGCLDCPDLPLNVSRSFLQNEGYVQKISNHITKKVADKLSLLYKKQKDDYIKYWNDINPFVKYGCIREDKFYDRVKDIVIFKTTNDRHITLEEYLNDNKEKHENKVFYVTDTNQQAQYINMFKEHGMEAVILNTMIDNHFISLLESKNLDVKFQRIDSDLSDSLKDKDEADEEETKKLAEKLENIFKDALDNKDLKVNVESLKSESTPAVILLSEQSRRMQEMSRMYGGGMDMGNMFPKEEKLVLNKKNKLIQSILEMSENKEKQEDVKIISQHIYDMAMMSHRQLDPEAMTKFIQRSTQLLEKNNIKVKSQKAETWGRFVRITGKASDHREYGGTVPMYRRKTEAKNTKRGHTSTRMTYEAEVCPHIYLINCYDQ